MFNWVKGVCDKVDEMRINFLDIWKVVRFDEVRDEDKKDWRGLEIEWEGLGEGGKNGRIEGWEMGGLGGGGCWVKW